MAFCPGFAYFRGKGRTGILRLLQKRREQSVSGKILRNFVSDIDQLIQHFDKEHPAQSKSQQKEIQKYERVYQLRDSDERPDAPKDIFESLL
jgi:hypothetical protein